MAFQKVVAKTRDLGREDDHEDLLLVAAEDVLDEGPAGADEDDGEEEKAAFEEVGDVVENGPGLDVDTCRVEDEDEDEDMV